MKQRNGRMMALTGTAIFGGLVIGTVAAAAGGVAPDADLALVRSQSPAVVASGSADEPSVVSQAIAAVAQRWAADQSGAASVTAPGLTSATGNAVAVVAAASVGTPVTVAPPTTGAAAAAATPTTAPASVTESAAAAPVVVAEQAPTAPATTAPAADPAPTQVSSGTAVVAEVVPPAPAAAADPASMSATDAIYAWFPDVYDQAVAVADCESSLNPAAVSRGGGNHGLFQINNVHRENFTAITGQPWDMVHTAYYNAQYARRLYDASGWRPWTCRP